jgi:hypothetical protein
MPQYASATVAAAINASIAPTSPSAELRVNLLSSRL